MGRSGKFLASDYDHVKPDLLLLGKAITGGVTALSVVLGSSEIISLLKPGMHGSTYGGNPLTCAVAIEAIKIIDEENLADNAMVQGEFFRNEITQIQNPKIKLVRGRGLLNAVAFDESIDTMQVCHNLFEKKLLAKPTRNNAMRFSPPLTITNEQMKGAIKIIKAVLSQL